MHERAFKRSLDSLEALFDFLNAFLAGHGIAGRTALELQLALEEVFANSVEHNRTSTGDVAVALKRTPEAITIRIRDFDVDPFDVSRPPQVDTHAALEERHAGGLGLHLIHTIMDRVEYAREERTSIITLVKYLK